MLNIQNNSKVFKKIIVLVLLSTLSVSMYAQNCKSNIPNNYIDNTNGTITHKNTKPYVEKMLPRTNLEWAK